MVLCAILFFSSIGLVTNALQADARIETWVVYYFGATSCGPCNVPQNIKNIKRLKDEFPKRYSKNKIKFVMVCMDEDIEEGLKFVRKYGEWDEISIGSFYNNELALSKLNNTEIAGVPHVILYRNVTLKNEKSVPVLKESTLLVDLVGMRAIDKWLEDGYPVQK